MSEQPIVPYEPAIHGTSQALREALDDARRRAPGSTPGSVRAGSGCGSAFEPARPGRF